MSSFAERLEHYKKEEDFFLIDVYKGAETPFETIHDLTWNEVKKYLRKAKRSDKISGIEVLVEDWYNEDEGDNLFRHVCGVEKKPISWNVDLREKTMEAIRWR